MRMDQTNGSKPTKGEQIDSVYELFILVVVVITLLMLVAYYLPFLSEPTKRGLRWLSLYVGLIFPYDFVRSLRRAPDKRAYVLTWGWLDFLGSIPLILPLQIARVGRLVRAWRALERRGWSQVPEDLHRNRARSAAYFMALVIIITLPTAVVAVLGFESAAPEANIQSGPDAVWWSVVTMSTVGYGDFFPITSGGRVAALMLMTVGIGIYGVLTSYLAHFFLPRTISEVVTSELAEIQEDLDLVVARLEAIQDMIEERAPPAGDAGAETG
jgi:voltage-gated potassium channel